MKEKIDSSALYGKIAGCLLAGAVGDALGYEVEFDSWSKIRTRFGEKGIQKPFLYSDKAIFSDDTQMTLFTLEGIIIGYWRANEKGISAPIEVYIWQAYLSWLKSQGIKPKNNMYGFDSVSELLREPAMCVPRAPGNTCLSALSSGEMGKINEPINHSKGCGGVMRTAPLGFFPFIENPITAGAKVAAITHGHPLGWLPAGVLSGIVHACIYKHTKETPLKEIIENVIRETAELFPDHETYMKELEALLHKAIAMSSEKLNDVEAIEKLGGGWTGDEALAIAVYSCLKYPYQMNKALICAANHSGDSDSTAAIAGNILGAYLGLDGLDMRWVYQLELRHLIMRYACKAVEILLYHEYRLKDESAMVKARAYNFMKKYESLMRVVNEDQQLRERCRQYDIDKDSGSDGLFNYLFNDFYRDVCYLRNDSYFLGGPGFYQYFESNTGTDLQHQHLCTDTLLKMTDDGYKGQFISAAVSSGRVYNRISSYLKYSYIDTANIKTVKPAEVTETPAPKPMKQKERITECLDNDRIWFLSTFYDSNGNIRVYSLDRELAEDSHYEFKDAESIRRKIYMKGDENLSFGEILRRYTLANGGEKTLSLIWPYITAQFHYD